MFDGKQVKGWVPQARIANWITFKVKAMAQIDGTLSSCCITDIHLALEGVEGVLVVRYDRERGRFALGFDPRKVTLLKILSAIETLGAEKERSYRLAEAEAMGWETLEALEPAASQLQLF